MKTHRRTVLLASLTSVTAIAGCVDDEPTESGNESADEMDTADDDQSSGNGTESADEIDAVNDDRSDDETESDGSTDVGEILVYIAVDIPDDAPVLDAKADSLLENEHLKTALEQADDEYEPGMEDELDPEDATEFGNEIVHNEIRGYDEIRAVVRALDRDNEVSGLEWYVEYSRTTYIINIGFPPE